MNDIDTKAAREAYEKSWAADPAFAPADPTTYQVFLAAYEAALRNERRARATVAIVEWRIEGHTTWVAQECESHTAAQALAVRLRDAAEVLSYAIEIEIQNMRGVGKDGAGTNSAKARPCTDSSEVCR